MPRLHRAGRLVTRVRVRLATNDPWGRLWSITCPCGEFGLRTDWETAIAWANTHAVSPHWPGTIRWGDAPF